MPERPNILLLMTDQHRGDCLGVEGRHPVQTPYLDELALTGTRFTKAYTACPVSIAARRTLMTGTRPQTHRVLMNAWCDLPMPTLPGVLRDAGYQTHLVGKLHFQPVRARFGFDSIAQADGPWVGRGTTPGQNDYFRYLARHGVDPEEAIAHGMSFNGHPARPFHLEERFHFSNWCATEALEFLERRDPTCPFFLKVSLLHPHQPLTPPRDYLEKYLRPEVDIPEPVVGEWARVFAENDPTLPVDAWRIALPPDQMRYVRAAYYATVEHLDHQFGRILRAIPRDTVILFCSDHGEMLGDHQWLRKRTPWEPSARVPMIVRLPQSMQQQRGRTCDRPVELMDVMPTLLDAAGVDVPETVEGRSMLSLTRDDDVSWREYVHGECAQVPTVNSGMQFLTDGRRKYCWWPGRGEEQLFDLETDPQELHECAQDRPDEAAQWRARLVDELRDRPEGFVDNGQLVQLDGETPTVLPVS